MANYVGENIGKIYKNAQDKISINETEMMGKFFLVTEDLETTKWKMSGESKKIGQYTRQWPTNSCFYYKLRRHKIINWHGKSVIFVNF